MNAMIEIVEKLGFDKDKVKEAYLKQKVKEDYADEILAEEGLKGKSARLKVMKIMDTVGWDKKKIKTSLLRSTIASRIHHD
jgi:hypothetical protein